MTKPMPSRPTPNRNDLETLSAYIDGMLPEAERALLESRLRREPRLRQELNDLRQTVALVRGLPTLKAPRNFTLTADMLAESNEEAMSLLRRVRTIPRNVIKMPALSYVTAVASFALVMLGFLFIFSNLLEDTINSQFSEIVEVFGVDDRGSDSAVAMVPTATVDTQALSMATGTIGQDMMEAEESAATGAAAGAAAEAALTMPQQFDTTATADGAAASGIMADDFADMTEEVPPMIMMQPPQGTPGMEDQAIMPFATGTFDLTAQPEAEMFRFEATEIIEGQPLDEDQESAAEMLANDALATIDADAALEQPAPLEADGRAAVEQAQKAPESEKTDLLPIGIVLVVTGLVVALLTFLMRRLRNNTSR